MKKRVISKIVLVVLIIFLAYSLDCEAKVKGKFTSLSPGERWRVLAHQVEFADDGSIKRGWVLIISKSIILSQACLDKDNNIYVQAYTSTRFPTNSPREHSFTVSVKNIPRLTLDGIPTRFEKVSTRDCKVLAYDDLPLISYASSP